MLEQLFLFQSCEPAENTAPKQRGRPFSQGQSGNPAGRPRGARNRTTLAVQALLEGEAEAITRKAVALAKRGDLTAIRLVLERLLPPAKERPLALSLPPIASAEEALEALAHIIQAVACGDITTQEGQAVASLIEQWRRTFETGEVEKRLTALERGIH